MSASDEFEAQPTQMWKGDPAGPGQAPSTSAPRALLLTVKGSEVFRLPLKKPRSVVGRALDCDVKLDLLSVSRRHCVITLGEGGKHAVEDQNSSGGTFLNDVRVQGKVPLKDHDRLRIGDQAFTFVEIGAVDGDAFPVFFPETGGKPIELSSGVCTVGRSNATLTLSDPRISVKHAIVEIFGKGSVYVVDLHSTNGTFVNGRRIDAPTPIKSQDSVSFGGVTFKVRLDADREQKTQFGVVQGVVAQGNRDFTGTLSEADFDKALRANTAAGRTVSAPSAPAGSAASAPRPSAAEPAELPTKERVVLWLESVPRRLSSREQPFTKRFVMGVVAVVGMFYPYPLVISGDARLVAGTVQKARALVGGQVESVKVGDGQEVKKGDVLLVISDRDIAFEKKKAELALEQARSNLDAVLKGASKEQVTIAEERLKGMQTAAYYSKRTLDRNAELAKDGILSREALQNAQEHYSSASHAVREAQKQLELVSANPTKEIVDVARAELEKAEKDVALFTRQIEDTRLKAEIDGRIATPNVKTIENRFVSPGQELLEVHSTQEMVLEILVPEGEIADVSKGQEVQARIRTNPGRVYESAVELIHPVAEQGPLGSRVVVKARLDNSTGELIPGTSGVGKITGDRRLVISLVARRLMRVFKIDTF